MSRGKKGFLSGLALLSLGGFLLLGSPAGAQLVTSGEAAGEDNLPPDSVATVTADTTTVAGVRAIAVAWTLSPSDFVRQQPAGSDVSSGGTFVTVNDVAEYRVWRVASNPAGGSPDTTLVGSALAGETSFADTTLPAQARGMAFRYLVAAADAAGNESAKVSSPEVRLAAPGVPTTEVGGGIPKVGGWMHVQGGCGLAIQEVQDILCEVPAFTEFCPRIIVLQSRCVASIIVDYEILPDPTPGAPSAADLVALINEELRTNPNALAEAAAALGIETDLGAVLETGVLSLSSTDLGSVGPSQTVSKTVTIGNSSTDPTSIVSGTNQVSGPGFSVTDSSFAVAQGDSVSFDVVFTAAEVGNANGTYSGALTITMSDGSQTVVGLSATIVGGLAPPAVDLSTVSLNFAAVAVDSLKSITVTIANLGGLPLTGTLALGGDAVFSVSQTSLALDAAEDVDVEVTFAPADTLTYSGTLTISSNDPVRPEVTIPLAGIGVPAGFVPALPGDFDNSRLVDFDDFFMFADHFGTNTSSPIWDSLYDMIPNGEIDFDDFFAFADNFGRSL